MRDVLHWFGFDQESIPKDADVSFNFANLPESWRVFAFLSIIVLIGWVVYKIYQKESNSCPKGIKRLLFFLRLSVCLVLGVIFLEPSVTYTQTRSLRPIIKLLRDSSQSMNINDGYSSDESAKSASSV